MFKLKDNEYFLYQERCFPTTRNPRKNILERRVYPWKYVILGNSLNISSRNKVGLSEDVAKEIFPSNLTVKILYTPNHKSDYCADGTHSDIWVHQERGISKKEANKFVRFLSKEGINAESKEFFMSFKDFIN